MAKRYDQGNVRYFQTIDSAEKAYLLGFIAADGTIQRVKNSVGIEVSIHRKDISVLELLRTELGCENPILNLKPNPKNPHRANQVRLTLFNRELVEDLASHGIGPRKSLSLGSFTRNIPDIYKPAALLGYFDGDGSFTVQEKYRRGYIQIRAAEEVAQDFIKVFGFESYSISRRDAIPNLATGSQKNIIRFFEMTYAKFNLGLSRKKIRFEHYLSKYIRG